MRESFELQLQQLTELLPQIIAGIFALIIFTLIGRLISRGVDRFIGADKKPGLKQLRLVKRFIRWAFAVLGLVIALNFVGLTQVAASFLAAGGVVAVVLGFAFREIGENLLAGFFLSFSRSFDVGDLVESNGFVGIVKKIEIREVHIRTGDGRDIFVPSAVIYKNPLQNFTRDGLRRGNFKVGIDYGDDIEKAQELLLKTTQAVKYVIAEPKSSVQVSAFTPNYIELEVFFWINTFEEGPGLPTLKTKVMNACHKTLRENGFTFSSNVTTAVDMLPVNVRLTQDYLEKPD